MTRHSAFLDGCFFPVGEPYFLATLAVLRFTNFIPPRGGLEDAATRFVVVDEKLLDFVHERWRQIIEFVHFGVETRTNRNGNHAVVPDSFPLLGLLGFNHPDESRLNQTEREKWLV